jgi:Ca2+-binding RTX toxin-like protein
MTVTPLRLLALAAVVAAVAAAGSALTAGSVVPASNAGTQSFSVDANALKPAACAALNLTAIVQGATGTAASELILGTAGVDNISGNGGDDCILGGGGDDKLKGANGTGTVCVGGPGTDSFIQCPTSIQ